MTKKVGLIISSIRPGRNADKILEWVKENLPKTSFEIEYLDLLEWNLPFSQEPGFPSQGKYELEHTKKWSAKIQEYSGFIILTCEYNHGYPASLKNALDYLYNEWIGKPVSFISYGGVAGGTRAVEQLRQVVIELQMIPLREQVVIRLFDFFHASDFGPWKEQLQKTISQLEKALS